MDPRINYLTWVKNLYKDLIRLDQSGPFYNLTASSIAQPIDSFSNHLMLGLSRKALERTDPWSHPQLVERISRIESVKPENIMLSSGASGALFLICRTILEKGAHVIVETPCYEPLIAIPEFIGAEISYFNRKPENDYRIDPDELDSSILDRTKLIILTNLHNPSGYFIRDNELLSILEVGRKHNKEIKILVDEVYHRFVDQGILSAAKLDDGFISINSISKVYGLFMLRCGWIVAESKLIDNLRRVFILTENIGSPLNESVSSIFFQHLEDYNVYSQTILLENRKIIEETVRPLLDEGYLEGEIPEFGCIYFPRLVGIDDTRLFAQALGERQHVFLVPGRFFGSPQHVRIGFGGKPNVLREGLIRFGQELRLRRNK